MTDASSSPPSNPSRPPSTIASLLSPRSRKQFLLFAAGSSFLFLSTSITRRALIKRHRSVIPKFYQPSNRPPPTPVNGGFEAFEALNIATINVASFMMMMTGGLLWSLDISGLDDMRRMVRGRLGVDGIARSEQDVEEELEEWLAGVLTRKDEKEKRKDGAGGEGGKGINSMDDERGRPR